MIRFDPSEIDNWADKPEASHQLPELVRLLILATAPVPDLLRMPNGSSVRMPGWDGLLAVEGGNPCVPKGSSAWELSCENRIETKADSDYAKRTERPQRVDIAQTTFVFVTPRRWKGKDEWEEGHRRKGKWADVRALGADDLVAWLDQAPAVAGWFARLIGKLPDAGWLPLDVWWEHWSSATAPNIRPELVMAGRQAQVEYIERWFHAEPSASYVHGDTREEAIAFLAASATHAAVQWGSVLSTRTLVVQTRDAWTSLERHTSPLVLVRDFQDDLVSSQIAVSTGHHVLTPLDSSAELRGNGLTLPRLGRDETLHALVAMGLSESKAHSQIRKSARRLSVLRRFLQDDAGGQPPAWANTFPGSTVALVLLGQWEENHEGDKKIVARLVGQPYEEIEKEIVALVQVPDSPLVKVGSYWRFTSHEEAWHVLAPRLTPTSAARFKELATEVLGQVSPQFELPVDERYMASVRGKVLPHSDTLREGLARGLALMGVHPDRANLVESASYVPSNVVSDSLAEGKGWQIWATLSGILPILAEAAADPFLDAVERDLSAEPSPFKDLCAQAGAPMFAGVPHAGLFRALETLAWSQDHFSRVAMILARLTEFDRGGNVSPNSPNSLCGLFLPWIRFSDTLDDQRLDTLKTLVDRYPDMGYNLILALYRPGTVIERRPPRWRPWGQDGVRQATRGECLAFVNEMDRMLLELVGTDAGRWRDLVASTSELLPATLREALGLLSRRIEDLRRDPSVGDLWAKVRGELHRHRRYSTSAWAMGKEDVAILDHCYKGLTPSDPIAANAWLFDGYVELPDPTPYWPDRGVDHDKDSQQVAGAREAAITTVYEGGGDSAILALAEAAKEPSQVGAEYGQYIGVDKAVPLALTHLQSANEKLQEFAFAILRSLFLQSGWDALTMVVEQVKAMGHPPEAVATVYWAARPAGPDTWERLAAEEPETQAAYWKSVPWSIAGLEDTKNVSIVAQHLLEVGRSPEAAQLLEYSPASPEAIILVLERLPIDLSNEVATRGRLQGRVGYMVAELLGRLDGADEVSEDVVARLEIPYVGLLRHDRPNLALHRQVLRTPSLFADLIARVFKRSDGQVDEDVDEHTRRNRARAALDILWELRGIPGQREDRTIDQDTLGNWVNDARRLCKERAREVIGDERIGQLLANAPVDADGIWPCEPVRDLLNSLGSQHLGEGFIIGKYNLRGVVTKGPLGGGNQERSLAARYREDASKLTARWPFTAKLLRDLAVGYETESRWSDREADWRDQFEM